MKHKIIAIYSIIIGIAVIALWILILKNQQTVEGSTEILFHVFSEYLMAVICVISGLLLLKKFWMAKPLNLLGLGMVIYSVLNAAGYYSQRSDIAMMFLFLFLFISTTVVILLHFFKTKGN
jgi:tellurite resistance protein TehA-like permease